MKTLKLLLIATTILFTISQVQANDFEVALSSETAWLTRGSADLAFGVFFNDDNDIIGQISSLQTRQASESSPLTLGVGLRGYAGHLSPSSENIVALGIGGEIRYTVPGVMPIAIYLQGHHAPQITSFSDTESVTDLLLRYQIEILPQTIAFAGIQRLEIRTKTVRNYEVDDNRFHFGVRLAF